jgi:hypothetical protein
MRRRTSRPWKQKIENLSCVFRLNGMCTAPNCFECFTEAVKAYNEPNGFLILITGQATDQSSNVGELTGQATDQSSNVGELAIECYGKQPAEMRRFFLSFCSSLPKPSPQSWFEGMVNPICVSHAYLEWLHECRHGRSLDQDTEAERGGDKEALYRLQRTEADYFSIRNGKASQPTRRKVDHLAILKIGSYFGLGNLTAEELAECLDQVCPCRQRFHSADALKRLRRQIYAKRESKSGAEGAVSLPEPPPQPTDKQDRPQR